MGLTLQQVADKAGMTKQSYHQYERGRYEPTVAQFRRLIEAMGLKPIVGYESPNLSAM